MDLVIAVAAGVPADRARALEALGRTIPLDGDGRSPADGADSLEGAGCAVVGGATPTALREARAIHARDPSLQTVAMVAEEERAKLERALLFTPGMGELWVAAEGAVTRELLERASTVTAQRRRYRSTRRVLVEGLDDVASQPTRRALVSDAFLAALLTVLPDPVISIDERDVVLSWNPAAERLLGVPRSTAVGQRLQAVLRADDPAELDRMLEEGRHALARSDFRFSATGGIAATAELAVVPVEAGGHQVRSVLVHDVTERRKVQRALEEQALELETQAAQMQEQAAELELLNAELFERTRALEDAVEARSRFYAAMSHELRTPMNAIIGYNSLLLDGLYGDLDGPQREAIERGQRAAQHLLELVNDTLDLAKIEAGRIDLQVEETSLGDLLRELLVTVGPMAEMNATPLEIENRECASIRTDPRRVRQVVLNLLSNAIKFGRRRPVRVVCRGLPQGGAAVEVHDQGVGLREEDVARIFDEFVQLGNPGEGGTGLGLTISRRLAEALGGSLAVESEEGRGSTFSLILPPAPPGEQ